MSRILQRPAMRPPGMRTALVGAAIVVAVAATVAATLPDTMPDTATVVPPSPSEREARMIEAVMRDLPAEYRERSVAMDPRWAPLPGGEASLGVLLGEDNALRVRHGEAIGADVVAALEARGLTPTFCEGGLDFACIEAFETVHLVFAKPAMDLEGASMRVLISGRSFPDSHPNSYRAHFEVAEYALDMSAERVVVTGRTPVVQGHGRVPASLQSGGH